MSIKSHTTSIAVAMCIGAGTFTVPAFAAGGGGEGGGAVIPSCKRNMVWNKSKRKCIKVSAVKASKSKKCKNKKKSLFSRKVKCLDKKKSSMLDDNNIYEAARDLAYHRRYEEAITLLELATNQDDPRILNYLGYSNRKLGRVEKGLTYYTAALKADPDYTLVREYMGEAFLQLGQVDKAREQLSAIEKRCGVECREYTMLSAEITRHLTK
ncbi:MAG: tetratricopeptide repeat protein [Rhizobiaceae bacterium]